MPNTSFLNNLIAGVTCNFKLATIKIFVFLLRISPNKILLINIWAIVRGFFQAIRSRKKWSDITAFAQKINSTAPWRTFILKFFYHQVKIRILANVYYEIPSHLDKYILTEQADVLKATVTGGDGAIILGAHFGPPINTFALKQAGIEVRPVFSNIRFDNLEAIKRHGLRLLMRKQFLFITDQMRPFFAGKSEKELLVYLKSGGIVSMNIDFPKVSAGGTIVDFFNKPLSFSYFPFKLSLRYGVPVFFYYLAPDKSGGYRLHLVPSGPFSTPKEGVKEYVRFFQNLISDYPYLWMNLPDFMAWPPAEEKALVPQ